MRPAPPDGLASALKRQMWGVFAAVLGGAVVLAALESAADLLRGKGGATGPGHSRKTELLGERKEANSRGSGSGGSEAGGAGSGGQQTRRGFSTAARGFAAHGVRSVKRMPRAL